MDGSLEPIRLKLIRAQEHFEALCEILDGFRYGECEVAPEQDPETKLGVLRVRLPEPPPRLKLIVSDFFSNVRSALDYLVTQLVLANGQTPGKSNSFPITTNPKEFADAVRRGKLKGISAPAQALIENLQPYPGRNQLLATLNHLHNPDKHVDFALTTAVANDTRTGWMSGDRTFLQMILSDEELRNGAIFGDIAIDFDALLAADSTMHGLSERFKNMKVKGQAAIFVAFDDPEAEELEPWKVDSVLEEILEFFRETVVPGFEAFLD